MSSTRRKFLAFLGLAAGAVSSRLLPDISPAVAKKAARPAVAVLNPAWVSAPYEIIFCHTGETIAPKDTAPHLWKRDAPLPFLAAYRHSMYPPRFDERGQPVPTFRILDSDGKKIDERV